MNSLLEHNENGFLKQIQPPGEDVTCHLYINGSMSAESKLPPLHHDENLDNRSTMSFMNLMFPISVLRISTMTAWYSLAIRIYAHPPGFEPADLNAKAADYLEAVVAFELEPVKQDAWDVVLAHPPEDGLLAR